MTADYRAQGLYEDRGGRAYAGGPEKQRAAQPERRCAAHGSGCDPGADGRNQDAMPTPNTCILPALTWRGSVMLDTILPAGTGIVCAKR